jgi:hypothetical protein
MQHDYSWMYDDILQVRLIKVLIENITYIGDAMFHILNSSDILGLFLKCYFGNGLTSLLMLL